MATPEAGPSTPLTTTHTNTNTTRPPILIPITIPSFDEALEKLRALPPLQIPPSTSLPSLPSIASSERDSSHGSHRTSERHSSDRNSHSHRSHSHRHHHCSHPHHCSKHKRKETPEERRARHALRASETPSQRAERHALRLLKRMRKELKRLTAENTYLRFVAELRRLRERPERFELVRRGEGLRWVGGLSGGRDPKLSLSWGPLREGGGKDRREKWVIEMEEREREIEELQRGMQGIEIAGTGKYEDEGMDWEREGQGQGEVEPQFPVSPIVEEPVFPVSPVEFPSSPVEGGDFSFSESNGEGGDFSFPSGDGDVQWIVEGEDGDGEEVQWTVEGEYEDGVYEDGDGGQWTVVGGHWTRVVDGTGGEFTFAESPGEFTFAESPGEFTFAESPGEFSFAESPGEFTFLPGDGGRGGHWVRNGGGGGSGTGTSGVS